MNSQQFFEALWQDYTRLTPQAATIQQLFRDDGNSIVNDHVAFRTFADSAISLEQLEPHILGLGYDCFDEYRFAEKHLRARAYLPRESLQPRIFLSELLWAELSGESQQLCKAFIDQIDPNCVTNAEVFWIGRLWAMPHWSDYQSLLMESEYAAWLSIHGLHANHFTISVNVLKDDSLNYVNDLLRAAGFALNTSGGLVKGTPLSLLEQSATLADETMLTFADGDQHVVPTCYYEFAKRYRDDSGKLYQGFVADNANHIFHSTDRQLH